MSGQYTEDGSALPDGAFAAYKEKMAEASQAFGTRLDVVPEVAGMMRKAGFVDVVERKIKTPIGTWAKDKKWKEVGMWINALNDGSLEAYGLALFTRVLGMTEEKAKEMIDAAVKDLKNTKIRWWYYRFVVARLQLAEGDANGAAAMSFMAGNRWMAKRRLLLLLEVVFVVSIKCSIAVPSASTLSISGSTCLSSHAVIHHPLSSTLTAQINNQKNPLGISFNPSKSPASHSPNRFTIASKTALSNSPTIGNLLPNNFLALA